MRGILPPPREMRDGVARVRACATLTRNVLGATDLLRDVALVGAGGFGVGIVVYVGCSFALMRAHTDARSTWAVLREALREVLWALLTQPLVPLFYFVGRRLGDGGGRVPVVVVHGYSQNRVNFLRIARALAKVKSGPIYGFNYAWFARVPASAEKLARFVEDVKRETGAAQVDLVCHSLGGLVAMEYLRGRGAGLVRRCVTIASPHGGVAYRGPIVGACATDLRVGSDLLRSHAAHTLAVPCLSIYSAHDNVVHPPATSTLAHRGGRDHVVSHLSHLSLLFSPAVAYEVADFLGAVAPETRARGASSVTAAATELRRGLIG